MCSRLVWVCLLVAACTGDEHDAEVDRRTCEKLRDHLVEVRLKDAVPADVAAHRSAMKKVLGEDFIASCSKDLSPAQVKCALAATDNTAASNCGAQ